MKKYELTYLTSFIDDMRLITEFLSQYPEGISDKFVVEVEKQIQSLRAFPKKFAVFEPMPVFRRMLVLYDYQVFYTINEEKRLVQVHHILHGHRDILKFMQYESEFGSSHVNSKSSSPYETVKKIS